MTTQMELDKAGEDFDRIFNNCEDPTPMDPDRQEYFQRRCAKEAELLRYFLTKPLTKKARKEITDFEQLFSKASLMPVVAIGLSRSLAPFMGRSLTAYRAGEVQSYRRRPKGKIYERV